MIEILPGELSPEDARTLTRIVNRVLERLPVDGPITPTFDFHGGYFNETLPS